MIGIKKQTNLYKKATQKLNEFNLFLRYYNQNPSAIRLRVANQLLNIK